MSDFVESLTKMSNISWITLIYMFSLENSHFWGIALFSTKPTFTLSHRIMNISPYYEHLTISWILFLTISWIPMNLLVLFSLWLLFICLLKSYLLFFQLFHPDLLTTDLMFITCIFEWSQHNQNSIFLSFLCCLLSEASWLLSYSLSSPQRIQNRNYFTPRGVCMLHSYTHYFTPLCFLQTIYLIFFSIFLKTWVWRIPELNWSITAPLSLIINQNPVSAINARTFNDPKDITNRLEQSFFVNFAVVFFTDWQHIHIASVTYRKRPQSNWRQGCGDMR